MRWTIILLMIVAVLLSGCAEQEDTVDEINIESILATDLEQIDQALENGPVLITIGAENCPYCVEQKPVLVELANEYGSRASVMYIDADISPQLAIMFNAYTIPDTTVILDGQNREYRYMAEDGPTDNRGNARFVGFRDKGVLEQRLDRAIEARND